MSGGLNINNTGKTYETSIEKSAKQNQELIGKLKPMETGSIFDKPKADKEKVYKTDLDRDLDVIPRELRSLAKGGKHANLFEELDETGLSKHASQQSLLTRMKNTLTKDAQAIAAQKAELNDSKKIQ